MSYIRILRVGNKRSKDEKSVFEGEEVLTDSVSRRGKPVF